MALSRSVKQAAAVFGLAAALLSGEPRRAAAQLTFLQRPLNQGLLTHQPNINGAPNEDVFVINVNKDTPSTLGFQGQHGASLSSPAGFSFARQLSQQLATSEHAVAPVNGIRSATSAADLEPVVNVLRSNIAELWGSKPGTVSIETESQKDVDSGSVVQMKLHVTIENPNIHLNAGSPQTSGTMQTISSQAAAHAAEEIDHKLLEQIRAVVTEQLHIKDSELELKSHFEYDLGADSLAKMEVLLAVEKTTGVQIPEEMTPEIQTLQQLYDATVKARNGPPPSGESPALVAAVREAQVAAHDAEVAAQAAMKAVAAARKA